MNSYDPTKPYKTKILELIQGTWNTPYVSVKSGAYPIITKKFSGAEVDHTDGIGTKGFYHWKAGTLKNAVLDALAMNLNDLALARAVPYKLQNHLFLPEDKESAVQEIIEVLVEECKKRNIAITGGETSIHNNMAGMDISITMSGFVESLKSNSFQIGDILFGFSSSGLHSNGFTKIREIFGKEPREEFTIPTRIYLDDIYSLGKIVDINGMMHITGGAFTKLKDLLHGADAVIKKNDSIFPHPIFHELHEKGISDEEMYKTFNCGIGFVFSVSKQDAKRASFNAEVYEIGEIISGEGKVRIESAFSNKTIQL